MKNLLTILILLLCTSLIQAQESRRERIKSLKVAYLTEKLELTPEEAAKFWPVYNEYEDQEFELRKSLKETLRDIALKDPATLSEQEAAEVQKQVLSLRKKIEQTEFRFLEQVPELLGAKKALYLDIYEEKFRRELLKKLEARRAGRRQG